MSILSRRLSIQTAIKFRIYFFCKKILKIYFKETYSQIGEDIAIGHILNDLKIKEGVYVDIGCNNPVIFSNSFKLYLNGWKGIAIDLNEDFKKKYQKERNQDVFIQAAISDKEEVVPIYEFNDNLISSINKDFYEEFKLRFKPKPLTKKIKTQTIDKILIKYGINKIDLLLIDVEGHDFSVLKSINLNHYRPKLIVIELHKFNLNDASNNKVVCYLRTFNYKLIGYLIANAYFIEDD